MAKYENFLQNAKKSAPFSISENIFFFLVGEEKPKFSLALAGPSHFSGLETVYFRPNSAPVRCGIALLKNFLSKEIFNPLKKIN